MKQQVFFILNNYVYLVPTAPPRKSRFRGNSTGNKEKRKSNITNDLLNKSAPLLEETDDFPHSVNVLAHFHPKLANGKDMSINTYKGQSFILYIVTYLNN